MDHDARNEILISSTEVVTFLPISSVWKWSSFESQAALKVTGVVILKYKVWYLRHINHLKCWSGIKKMNLIYR